MTDIPSENCARNQGPHRGRTAVAPYGYGTHVRRRDLPHPAQPLVWAMVLIVVPMFWITAIAWFTRVVF